MHESDSRPHPAWAYPITKSIAHHLPLFALLRLRFLVDPGPTVVDHEIRQRVVATFSPYIPNNQAEFFDTLKKCRAIGTGTVVKEFFLFNIPENAAETGVDFQANDDDEEGEGQAPPLLIIAERNVQKLATFLQSINYEELELSKRQSLRILSVFNGHFEVIKEVEAYRRIGGNGKIYTVFLMTSRWSALRALLSVDNTSDMVAVSHDTVACYYPRLAYKREGLMRTRGLKAGDDQMTIYLDEGVVLQSTNEHWEHPCGPYCPETWRFSYDDGGVCKIKWSFRPRGDAGGGEGGRPGETGKEGDDSETLDFTYGDLLSWRVANRCLNNHCRNARLHDLRKEYVDM